MWTINRAFFNSYMLLCFLSSVCFGQPEIQRLLVVAWIIYTARVIKRARQQGARFLMLLGVICVTQLPGIILMLINIRYIVSGTVKEWAGGLLEAWYHPFVPLLEMLPRGDIGNWSDMYLQTCFIPVAIISVSSICWIIVGRSRTGNDMWE